MTTLAIDIGGTKIAAAVCDENDSIIQRWRVPTPMDADAINQHIAEVYREAVAAGHTDIEAIGISAAGNVSADRKTLTFSANIPAWINYDLSEHVGALIVRNDEIIATGYNGAPRGRANCIDIGTCIRQKMGIPRGERYEFCRSVHAEMNAIIAAPRDQMIGATLYLVGRDMSTGKIMSDANSCTMCKRLIINAGIEKVVIRRDVDTYDTVNVHDWVENDDTLGSSMAY